VLKCTSRLDRVDTGERKEELSSSLMEKKFFVEPAAFAMMINKSHTLSLSISLQLTGLPDHKPSTGRRDGTVGELDRKAR
jgi:hypothetical protein